MIDSINKPGSGPQSPGAADTQGLGLNKNKNVGLKTTDGDFPKVPLMEPDPTTGGPTQPVLIPPRYDQESLTFLLMELREKTSDVQMKGSKEEILENMEKNRIVNKDKLAKLEDCLEKIKEATEKRKKKSIWGWIGAGFGFVASLIGAIVLSALAVVAAFFAVTGFGAAAAIGLGIAAGGAWVGVLASGINLGKMIADETGLTEWIATEIAKSRAGGDEQKMQEIKQDIMKDIATTFMIVTTVLMVVSCVAQVGGAVVTGGAGILSWLASAPAMFASGGSAAMTGVGVLGGLASGAAQIGAGGAGVASGNYAIQEANLNKEAMDAEADAMAFEAIMKKLQGAMEEEMDRLKELIEELEESMSRVMDILSSNQETTSQIIKRMI
jgi:hypothetical protein